MPMFLIICITIIIITISLDMLIYFVISKRSKNESKTMGDQHLNDGEGNGAEEITIVEVEFKGYKGTFTYSSLSQPVMKGQYVLVLTRDGIRCARAITDSQTIKQYQLKCPPFLLENIVCIADEMDIDYYS